jgi:Ca-activated chloride channel family protein
MLAIVTRARCLSTSRTSAFGVAVAAAVCAGWTAPAFSQAIFRTGTTVVALPVTVIDQNQRHVTGLQVDDFAVFDEGERQTVSLFAPETAPLDVLLLLDTSDSMSRQMPLLKRLAVQFVRTLAPDDRAAILLFNQRVRFAQELTADTSRLERAITRLPTGGGTMLHDALYTALLELARASRGDAGLRRRALVFISDAEDTVSQVPLDTVFEQASRTPVTIFAIVPPKHVPTLDERLSRLRILFEARRLAEQSGGRAFMPQRDEELHRAHDDIATELRHQYWLGYIPPVGVERFRRVSVRVVRNPMLQARTRLGYAAIEADSGLRSFLRAPP